MSVADKFTVHVINPKGKKKAAKKKANKKGAKPMAGKKKTGKRKTKKRAAPSSAPRKRRKNPAPKKKKRKGRRKNPSFGFPSLGGLFGEAQKALPRVAGMLAVAWAVKQWGGTGSLWNGDGTVVTSEFAGTSWNWRQYGIALAVATIGPKILGRLVDANGFRQGAMDAIVQKFVWTEGIAKTEWGKNAFGNDVYRDSDSGQMYWDQGGRQVAMQGLTHAGPLDGLVEASAMDGVGSGYGHLLPAGVSEQTAMTGAYSQSGYTDPYHAAVAA